eukprot:355472_1
MGGGNGCKSKMKQQRNAAKNAKKGGISTKSKEHQKLASASICAVCRQSFPNTAKQATLKAHVEAKHSSKKSTKTFEECFPTFGMASDSGSSQDYDNKNKKQKQKQKKKKHKK